MWILLLVIGGLSALVSWRFRSRFNEYSKIPIQAGLSGKEIAEKMLYDNNITDVKVLAGEGMLSDHYNPANKTVNLSPEVYNGRSIASAAVAAHECGHAVQHQVGYSWLKFRSAVVPAVSITSKFIPWLLIGGVLTISVFPFLLGLGILLFALTTFFSFITLPVEFDASNRALKWLESTRITVGEEHDKAKNALKWAASTYVVAAISSLVTLLYYVSIFLGNRRNN
ncbi:MAG: zinc metallopeptidase [Bacteroidota bacterium]|nr:zinc metallopeptidase [Bacteroidota bacterium]